MVSYFMLLWMERARGWPNRSFDGSVLFGGGMGGGGEGGYRNGGNIDRSTSRVRTMTTRGSGMPHRSVST